MRVLVDASMSPVMVQLRIAGHDAVHVGDVLRLNAQPLTQATPALKGADGQAAGTRKADKSPGAGTGRPEVVVLPCLRAAIRHSPPTLDGAHAPE